VTQARKMLAQLGDEFVAIACGTQKTWATTKERLGDPLMLERFALSCHTGAQALEQLAERAREYAGDLIDGDDD
jgi:hypothetical protein